MYARETTSRRPFAVTRHTAQSRSATEGSRAFTFLGIDRRISRKSIPNTQHTKKETMRAEEDAIPPFTMCRRAALCFLHQFLFRDVFAIVHVLFFFFFHSLEDKFLCFRRGLGTPVTWDDNRHRAHRQVLRVDYASSHRCCACVATGLVAPTSASYISAKICLLLLLGVIAASFGGRANSSQASVTTSPFFGTTIERLRTNAKDRPFRPFVGWP